MYYFLGNCTQINSDVITAMVDEAEEIEYEDLTEHVPQKELRLIFPGYEWSRQGGLQLHNDHYVKFYKSIVNGRKCLYVTHSAIEHIWVDLGEKNG